MRYPMPGPGSTSFISLCALALSISLLLGGCASDPDPSGSPKPAHGATPSGSTTSSPPAVATIGSDCKPPEKVSFPDWMPSDLPLPKGTFAYQDLPVVSGFHRGLFAVPGGDTRSFANLVLGKWPKAGYTLGRGDSEPGEVEDDFTKGSGTGAFKANDLPCKKALMEILIIYTKHAPKGILSTTPAPTGSPVKKKN